MDVYALSFSQMLILETLLLLSRIYTFIIVYSHDLILTVAGVF